MDRRDSTIAVITRKILRYCFKKKIAKLLWLFIFITAIGFSSCRDSQLNPYCWGECEEAVLYYYGRQCASINGVIEFVHSNEAYVFQHEVPKAFRKDSIKVCIRYRKIGKRILTADCEMYEVIKLLCIRKR